MKSSSYILNLKSNVECVVYLVVDIPGGHVEYEEWSAYHGDEYPDRIQAGMGKKDSVNRLAPAQCC